MSADTTVAIIAAVPATLAAGAAWFQSRRNTAKLDTGNGHTLGEYAPLLMERLDSHGQTLTLHSEKLEWLGHKIDNHADDDDRRFDEQNVQLALIQSDAKAAAVAAVAVAAAPNLPTEVIVKQQ